MLDASMSAKRVAAAFGVHHTTLYRVQDRMAATGSVSDRPRPGQPRVTTPRQGHVIRLLHVRNPFQTAADTAMGTAT